MKALILNISLIALVIHSAPSFSNSSFGPVNVISVSVSDFNMLTLEIDPNAANKHTEQCDIERKNQLVINPSSPYEKEMFSIALAAKASGKSITGWVNGCHTFGAYKAPKMTVISIKE